jgi:serine protease
MPAVINISIEAGSSQSLIDAVDRAVASGITVVVAAGNNSGDACNYSPANAANAITVGATSKNDFIASFSNQGPCVDLMAPGEQIASAMDWDDTSLEWGSGTSMAAPHVAGAAALLLQKNPTATPEQIAAELVQTATMDSLAGVQPSTPNLILRTDR